jgi:hypothetical protein
MKPFEMLVTPAGACIRGVLADVDPMGRLSPVALSKANHSAR